MSIAYLSVPYSNFNKFKGIVSIYFEIAWRQLFRSASGQIGNGRFGVGDTLIEWKPVRISTGWKAVTVDGSHSCALKQNDNTLWCWGKNDVGQLGDLTTLNKNTPVQIGAARWLTVSAGDAHTLAVREDGTLWGWGSTMAGLLGNGIARKVNPVLIMGGGNSLPAVYKLLILPSGN